MRGGPPQSGLSLVLSLGARRGRPRSFDVLQEPPRSFRESDLLRKLFETVVARCMKEGIVGGQAFAVDASIIVADAHRRRGVAKIEDLDPTSNRAVTEYLSVLDDAAFGGATWSSQRRFRRSIRRPATPLQPMPLPVMLTLTITSSI